MIQLHYIYNKLNKLSEALEFYDEKYSNRINDLIESCSTEDLKVSEICTKISDGLRNLQKDMTIRYKNKIPVEKLIDDIEDDARTHARDITEERIDVAEYLNNNRYRELWNQLDLDYEPDLSNKKGYKTNCIDWDLRLLDVPKNFIDWYHPDGVHFTAAARLPYEYITDSQIDWKRVYKITIDPRAVTILDDITNIPEVDSKLRKGKGCLEYTNNPRTAAQANFKEFHMQYLGAICKNGAKVTREENAIAERFATLSLQTRLHPDKFIPQIEKTDLKGIVKIYNDWEKKLLNPKKSKDIDR